MNGLKLKSQYLQSCDVLLEIFMPIFEKERHNFADIEIRASVYESNLYIVKIDIAAF
jgi:hypothetical protein